jgi:hypothetical protein
VFIKIGRLELYAARDFVMPASARRPLYAVVRRGGRGFDVRIFDWRAVVSWIPGHRTVKRSR